MTQKSISTRFSWKIFSKISSVKSSVGCLSNGAYHSHDFLKQNLIINISLPKIFINYPSRPNPVRREKIKLNVYFRTSLWCLKRFYEGLKGLHKTFWGTTKKCDNKNLTIKKSFHWFELVCVSHTRKRVMMSGEMKIEIVIQLCLP